MELFFDTSAIFGWFSPRDGTHKRASDFMQKFREGKTDFKTLVITNAIFIECVDLTQRKLGKEEAVRLGDTLRQSKVVRVVDTTDTDKEDAWEIMSKYKDQDSNLTDSLSFAIMRRLRMRTAFTFDEHFKIHGYKMVP